MPPRATASRRRALWAAAAPAAAALFLAADARCAPEPPEVLKLTLTTSLLRDSNLFRRPEGETPPGILVESRADTITSVGVGLRLDKTISRLTKEMKEAAKNLDFERAAEIRDRLRELKEMRIFV